MLLRTIVLAAASAFAAGAAAAAELEVTVTGLRSGDGNVHVALYTRPEAFPSSKGVWADRVVPAAPAGVQARFADLAPGTYAVAVFHDENGNGRFDRGFLGLPLEGYAFSRDAAVFLGPPSFADAAFRVAPGGAAITIRMGY